MNEKQLVDRGIAIIDAISVCFTTDYYKIP